VTFAKTSLNRAALKGSAATLVLAMLATPVTAFAQTAAADTAADETIVVTGSLIRNPNLISAAPVNVTTADTIALRGSNVAEEVLRDIPGIVPSIGSAVNNGNGGASYVDLRGIGSTRNIVLLDGNRIAPSGFAGRVDLNNIPLALVARVDALTGAAVTTYGADAISGVVNFVTRQDFSGVDLQVSNSLTERGDGQRFRADLTVGGNFDDGRGNATLSMGYQTADPVYQGARDFSEFNIDSNFGTNGGSGTSVPSRFSGTRGQAGGVINTTSPFTQTGTIPNPKFDPTMPTTGSNFPTIPVLAPVTGGLTNGGSRQIDPTTGFTNGITGTDTNGTRFAPFNFNPYNIFQTPFERFNIFAQAKYEISDALEVYGRGMYSKNKVGTIIAPSGSFGATVSVPLNNPFLPAGLRSQFCALNVAPSSIGVDSTGKSVAGQASYTALYAPDQCARAAQGQSAIRNQLQVDSAGKPVIDPVTGLQQIEQVVVANPAVSTALARRTTELGPRTSDYTTQIFDYRAGLRGKITNSIDWDLSGSYGESSNSSVIGGYVLTSRLQQAVNSTNKTTCTVNTNGCVPIDVFGPEGSITPAMAAFLNVKSFTQIDTSLAQVRGVISGDSGITIPSAGEAIGFAVGAEYRKYTAEQTADSIASSAGQLGGGGAATIPFTGGYDVKEIYGEIIAPIVQDKPFFENLTIEAGARYSDYNVDAVGNPAYDAFTWKVGGNWEIGGGFKVRGNYSRAVRAPNLAELFQPPVVTLTSLGSDPCAGAAPTANANLRNVCVAQGAPIGLIGSILNPTAGQAQSTQSGSLALTPEKANTWTIGAVFQPTFAPGLSITVDYYNITVNDAITTPTSGDAIGDCFNNLTAASATKPECTAIRRNAATGGLDGPADTTPGLFLPLSNLGTIKTDGIDVTLNYSTDIGFARLGIQGNANYTFNSKFQATPTSIDRQCVGYYSPNCGIIGGSLQPKWQSSLRGTLSFTTFDASLVWRHIDGMEQEPLNQDPAGDDNLFFEPFRTIDSYDYFDLTGRFSITENLSLILTVTNLFDKQPPVVGGTSTGSTAFNSGNTFPSTYDPLGRRYTMQFGLKF
jgi:iron complex outermembrane recepter protein